MRAELKQLIDRHNEFAKIAGLKTIRSWSDDPRKLAKKVYSLRIKASHVGVSEAEALKHAAVRLLCHIDYVEKRAFKAGDDNQFKVGSVPSDECRTVGLAYEEVRRRLRQLYPECGVSVHSLRWYVSHIREGDYGERVLPQRRPRKKFERPASKRPSK
jgi:hypothetical protein